MSDELPERLKEILSSEAVWVEPPPELGARIQGLAGISQPLGALRRLRVWLPAAVTLLVLVVGAFLTFDRPDWEIDLVATSEAPLASAVVRGWNEAEGTRLRLEVNGLDHAAPGMYYEIWLTSPAGMHVSGGTFAGDGVVTAIVGVRRGDFPRIWITRESLDDDSGPSPETIFDSPI
jgi:hypothetical protein